MQSDVWHSSLLKLFLQPEGMPGAPLLFGLSLCARGCAWPCDGQPRGCAGGGGAACCTKAASASAGGSRASAGGGDAAAAGACCGDAGGSCAHAVVLCAKGGCATLGGWLLPRTRVGLPVNRGGGGLGRFLFGEEVFGLIKYYFWDFLRHSSVLARSRSL